MIHCRFWCESIRSDPKYWQWARVIVDTERYPEQQDGLLKSKLIGLAPKIWAGYNTGLDILKPLLKFIDEDNTPRLKKLTFSGALDLVNIDPGLVSSALLQVEWCNIPVAAAEHCEAILAGIRDSNNARLRHLVLYWESEISEVAPDLVAGAAMKLETFHAPLSRPQLEAIFTRLAATQDSRLRRLRSNSYDISSLDPGTLAGGLVKLNEVVVGEDHSYCLSADQVTALLSGIRDSPEVRLSKLHFFEKDLSQLPTELLVEALQKLEEVKFSEGKMTAAQFTAVLTMVKEGRMGRIKKIVFNWVTGMRSVSPALLKQAKLNKALKFQWFQYY